MNLTNNYLKKIFGDKFATLIDKTNKYNKQRRKSNVYEWY